MEDSQTNDPKSLMHRPIWRYRVAFAFSPLRGNSHRNTSSVSKYSPLPRALVGERSVRRLRRDARMSNRESLQNGHWDFENSIPRKREREREREEICGEIAYARHACDEEDDESRYSARARGTLITRRHYPALYKPVYGNITRSQFARVLFPEPRKPPRLDISIDTVTLPSPPAFR